MTILYGFIDLDERPNLNNGLAFKAAGIVVERSATNSVSGKDLVVTYIDPWAQVQTEWRSDADVRLQPMDATDYQRLRDALDAQIKRTSRS